ncbi:MAG: hypothetical protein ACK4MF_05870 [Hyphomicrobiaceae bacterium]
MQRLKWAAAAIALLVAIGGGFMLIDLDAHQTTANVHGRIESVSPMAVKGPSGALDVVVALDDGRRVHVVARASSKPSIGTGIDVTEHRHATGRTTFTVR